MDPITIALVAAKALGGIFGNRTAKRQAQTQQLQASVTSNLARSNLLRNAVAGYGQSLVAANRSGGFSPGAFSSSFSNLAADLRQIDHNHAAQNQQALATASAGRMSLLNSAIGAFTTLADGWAAGAPWASPASTGRGILRAPLQCSRCPIMPSPGKASPVPTGPGDQGRAQVQCLRNGGKFFPIRPPRPRWYRTSTLPGAGNSRQFLKGDRPDPVHGGGR
jgi:hypothetical protein